LNAIVGLCRIRLRVLFYEANEGGSLDLYGLTSTIVERNHKVKEIGLPQIAGRLFFKVGAANAQATIRTRTTKYECVFKKKVPTYGDV